KGKLPSILMVHGHWPGAKQDPVVQSRCIGAVKLGYVALVVDAFGAGERGVGTKLGEYHGDMTAATLLPVGLPLSGLQVYENMRAVDYLLTRPEVDKDRLGITGASGGGNQTMYAGAFDTRFKCVVPVCSSATIRLTSMPRAACARWSPAHSNSPRKAPFSGWLRRGPSWSSTPPATPSSSPSAKRRNRSPMRSRSSRSEER